MLAVEKPKQPKVIKYVWWDGFNMEKVEEVFPTLGFSRFTVHDEDPCEVRIPMGGNHVRHIEGGVYLYCELGGSNMDIFTLNKKEFEKTYNCLPKE